MRASSDGGIRSAALPEAAGRARSLELSSASDQAKAKNRLARARNESALKTLAHINQSRGQWPIAKG